MPVPLGAWSAPSGFNSEDKTMKRNQSLHGAFPIVAAALGNRFGVKVSVGGNDAYTTGAAINLPAYDSDDPTYKDVAWGYLAHEAGHLRFTDFEQFGTAASSPIRRTMVNFLEDARIEKLMQETYPGTRLTIERMTEHLIRSGLYPAPGDDDRVHPAKVLTQFIAYKLGHEFLRMSALASHADQAEELLERTFPAGAVTRLFGLLSEVPALQSTRDCVRLADRVLRMIEEEQEKEREKGRSRQEGQGTSQGEPDGGSNGKSQQPQPGDGNSGDADGGEDQAIDDEGSSSVAGSDQQAGQPQTDPTGTHRSSAGTPAASNGNRSQPADVGQSDSSGRSGSPTAEQAVQALAAVLSAGDDDVGRDVFETAQQWLGGEPRGSYDGRIALPTAVDPCMDAAAGKSVLDRVLGESGNIRASLQGLVQASRHDRSVHKRSGNRIDGRRLTRLATGDSRVFERRAHQRAPNTAIHILVDGSGSMVARTGNADRNLIDVAMDAAVALGLALEGIAGVNPAITRFPAQGGTVGPLLRHGQKVRQQTRAYVPYTCGTTPLAEALWYAASSVLGTREDRKVIIALTDGDPDDADMAVNIIRRCEATGIEVVGIGIHHDVSHLFGNAIRIDDVSALRSELFRTSRELLIAA